MSNTINTIKNGPGVFAKGVAEALRDNLVFLGFVDKADESDFDGKNGFKSGDTIYTSIPPRYISKSDDLDVTTDIQDSVEEKAPLVLNKTETIAMKLNSLELATDFDVKMALQRHGIPAAESIAHAMESRCFQIATQSIYNSVGTAGSNTFSVASILAARTKLNQNLCRTNDRALFMNSTSGALAVDARKGLFQDSQSIAEQYKNGMIGRADGFDWYETELVRNHTNGNDVTGVAIDDTPAEGDTSLVMDGFTNTTGTIKKGQIFTIDGCFQVHPITKEVTPVLQQFVVTADGTANGSGQITVNFQPALYSATSKGLQNIDGLPANNDAITFVGAASSSLTQSLAIHKSAFKLVTAPLYAPSGVDLVATQTVDGITVNIVRDFDVRTREVITRLDVLFGFDAVRPEWGCRITS